jgi:uncharacterized protein YggE
MKRILAVLAVVALIMTGLLLAGCQNSESSGNVSASQQTGIWVSGEGKVEVTPDIADLQLGVQAQAKTVSDAQNQASGAMNKVVSALSAAGIASKDIQTSYFSVQVVTRYNPDTQQNETTGYMVTNLVVVKIRNITNVGPIVDSVVAAGGDLTRINDLSFTVEDPTPYQTEARNQAMTDAQAKAVQMAQLAGVKLGRATYITESTSTPPTPQPFAISAVSGAASSPTSINAGQLEITDTVQVVYTIR